MGGKRNQSPPLLQEAESQASSRSLSPERSRPSSTMTRSAPERKAASRLSGLETVAESPVLESDAFSGGSEKNSRWPAFFSSPPSSAGRRSGGGPALNFATSSRRRELSS